MAENEQPKIIAVDFDGTLAENAWPDIGEAKEEVLEYCKQQKANGAQIILWTNRVGERLDEAVKWCEEHGLELDAVNDNLPQMTAFFNNNSRKVFANEYIDDRMSTRFNLSGEPQRIPWKKVEDILDDNFETGKYLCWLDGYALILWHWQGDARWIDFGWQKEYDYSEVRYCTKLNEPDGEDPRWLSEDRS